MSQREFEEENKIVSQNLHTTYGTNGKVCTDTNANTEDVLQATIGNFGRWQFRISILMPLLKFPIIWFELGIVFLAPPTDFWCKAPPEYQNMTSAAWRELITPGNFSGVPHSLLEPKTCFMKNLDSNLSSPSVIPCQWGYEYNHSTILTSIITEWDLVCERENLVELAQVTLMFGVLLGSIFFGVLADRYGRKNILLASIVLQTLFNVLATISPWYWLFLLFRFLLGVADGGTVITSYVICMEVVSGPWRTIISILYQIPGGIGNGIMALIAFFVRDWRELQYTLSAISVLYFTYICLIPESPRWLLAVGRHEEAIKILESAAMTNGVDRNTFRKIVEKFTFASAGSIKKPPMLALMQTKELRKRTLVICFIWFISGTIYYGFTQYIGQVSQNMYFAVLIGGLTTLPGTILCVWVVKRYGRRATISWTCIANTITFLLILAVPLGVFAQDWPRIILISLGVIGISISVPALYLFTSELFPTVVRNTGVGTAVMCSRLGAMIAPIVIASGGVLWFMPVVVLAVIAAVEALFIFFLPETFNMSLPESIQDVEDLNNKRNVNLHYSYNGYQQLVTEDKWLEKSSEL